MLGTASYFYSSLISEQNQVDIVGKIRYVVVPNVFKCPKTICNPANLSLLLKWFSEIKIIFYFNPILIPNGLLLQRLFLQPKLPHLAATLPLWHTLSLSLQCLALFPVLSVSYKYDNLMYFELSLIDNKCLQTHHCFTQKAALNNIYYIQVQ